MSNFWFATSDKPSRDEILVKDERTPEQAALDYLNYFHQKSRDNWAQMHELVPEEFKAAHSMLWDSYSEPFRLIGKTLQTDSNRWLVGAVAGLDGAKQPDIPVRFCLAEFEHYPGRMASKNFLKSLILGDTDVVQDGAGGFDNYSYQEINEEFDNSGFLAVVRVLKRGLVVVLGLVRPDIQSIRLVMPNSAPILLPPTNQSFLAILCESQSCKHSAIKDFYPTFNHTKDNKHYAPLSISVFDENDQRLGHSYWPSQRQLDRFNWYL